MSSANYPQAQGGGPKWELIWPEHVMDVRPLIEGAHYLEDQIMLGIGVPPELVKASQTGSGYSGRSIPREAFLTQQQCVADAMLQIFVEQVVRPLVLWNFGDIPFEVSCKSLLETQVEEKQTDEEKNGTKGATPGTPSAHGQPPMPQQPQPPQPAPAFSMDSKIVSIIQRALARMSA